MQELENVANSFPALGGEPLLISRVFQRHDDQGIEKPTEHEQVVDKKVAPAIGETVFFICLTLCLLAPRLVEKAKLLLLEFLISVRILGPQHVFVADSRLVAIFLLRLALMPELCSAVRINSFRQSFPLDPVKIDT